MKPLALGFALGLALSLWGVGLLAESAARPPAFSAGLHPAAPSAQRAGPACTPAPAEERAAQVIVAGLADVVHPGHPLVGELADVGVGGVLLGKGNVRNAAQVRRLVAAVRERSRRPVLITTDEEPGRGSNFGQVLGRFSSARTMARRGDTESVRLFARQLGVELANLGIDLVLAPVVDVTDGSATGVIGDRSFSGDSQVAARYALAFSRGLWSGGVLPAPKHFPGHGRSEADGRRELGVVTASLEQLRARDLPPFRAQFRTGVRMVVVGHVVYEALDPRLPASLSPQAYGLLRAMGFEGVAITDGLGLPALNRRWGFGDAAVMAIGAGADAVLLRDGTQARGVRDALVRAVASGRLSDARLSEAAGRMAWLRGGDSREMTCPSAL